MKPLRTLFAIKTIIPLVLFVHILLPSLAQQPAPLSLEKADQNSSTVFQQVTPPIHVQPVTHEHSPIQKAGHAMTSDSLKIFVQPVTTDTAPIRYGEHLPSKDNKTEQAVKVFVPSSGAEILSAITPENFQTLNIVNPTGPVGTPDQYAIPNDQTLSIAAPGFLGNDIDLDGEALTATAILDNVDNGALSAFADGRFSYTPNPGFTGTDSFAYRMRDASNNFSDSVWVAIEVLPPANRNPVGIPDAYAALGGTTLSIASPGFLGNDIDPDGEVLTATAILDNVDNGSLSAFADGRFSYTPNPGFTGTDSFAYRMRDASNNFSDSVWVTIEVLEGNRPPIGVDDAYTAVASTTLSIAAPGFLNNDIDPDGEPLTATAILDNVDNGSLSAFADGRFSYTPNPGFTGTDSFAYRMRDASNNSSDSVWVAIEVSPGGTTPIGTPDQYAIPNDQTLSIAAPGFLGNDIDLDGEALTATAILDNVDNGALSAFADGRFSYTPNPGFTGTDSFAYRMRDASNNFSDSVWVAIEVLPPANRNPVGIPDTYAALGGTTLSIASPGFLGNDIDPDGEVLTATAILDNVDNGSLSAFADGRFTYTPNPGFTGTDSFAYRMRDASNNFSDSVWVTIEVLEGNRPPIGVDDAYTAVASTTLSIAAPGFLGNDIDLDGELLTATAILDNVDNGALSAFADGRFSYTPNPGFTGTDSFAYRMRDASNNSSDSVWVAIDIISPNNPPVADAGENQTVECTGADSVKITLDGSGSSDPDGDPLTYTWREAGEIIAGPTLDAQSEVMLAFGPHTIELTVEDGKGKSDTAEVMIIIDDTTPPMVSAAFVPVFDYGFLKLFNLECSAFDLCDDSLTTTSVIALPELNNPHLRFKKRKFKRIKIKTNRNKVVVEGPNPKAFWSEIQSAGGIPVKNQQHLAMLRGPQHLYHYKFDKKGELKAIIGPEALLRCTATDASGNTATAEATPPNKHPKHKNVLAGANASLKKENQPEDIQKQDIGISPDAFRIEQNFPNPFTRATTIRFALPEAGNVQVKIYNSMGQPVTTLVDKYLPSGSHEVTWESGGSPTGVYYYQIHTGTFSQVRQMLLLR